MSSGKAVILLSGGLDSSTTLAVAREQGFECHALTVFYGQRHSVERMAARKVAAHQGVTEHREFHLDLRLFGGSALTDEIDVPRNTDLDDTGDIPVTYVPARNTMFLSLALGWAEVLGANHIFIGANAVDYSGYPDCRPEFIQAYEKLANIATKAGVEGNRFHIEAPLINMSKREIILLGQQMGVDYSLTHSCYDPTSEGVACGKCDSCRLRLKGFAEAGLTDPIRYVRRPGTTLQGD